MTRLPIHHRAYKQLFRIKGEVTCLHTEFFLNGSLKLGEPVCVCSDGVWHSFIHVHKEKHCLKKGLEIFRSQSRYADYKKEFLTYMEMIRREILPRYARVSRKISREEVERAIQELAKFWHYYGMTEFSYHDLAYATMKRTKDPVLKKNLKDLGMLKIEGRKIMNKLIFQQGVIPNILTSVSQKFLENPNDAFYLYSREILQLFDRKRMFIDIIEKRKNTYAACVVRQKFIPLSSRDSRALAHRLLRTHEAKEVQGIVAYPGNARGRAMIVPAIIDASVINGLVKSMKPGDVLVAHSTTPEFMVLCNKAGAIVTDQGGMLSHAAVISRELKIPCVVGTQVATEVFKQGDWLEVDARKGVIRKITTKC